MERIWRIRPHDTALIQRIERAAHVSSVVARLLAARGITHPEDATTFLDSKLSALRDPEELPGLPTAADRIAQAIRDQTRIVIYGDYDADGMTSSAILLRCLHHLQANVGYYVPNRLDEGYGLNQGAIERLAQIGTQLIVSVDCGIGSIAEADAARQLGVELIITDHHQLSETLPNASAIVHPQLPGAHYPFPYLCGAGIAFKLAWAICQRASQAKRVTTAARELLLSVLSLAAIGTVADVVPLIDENRVIVKHGLLSLQARPSIGLAELLRTTGLAQKASLSSEDIGFSLGPRLNAAGRLGQAQLGVELLSTDNVERARVLADYLEELNNNRLHLERSIYLSANKQIKENFHPESDAALVLADRGWHQGVIGIVAGRLVEKYHRPVVMISMDDLGIKPGTGSVRSIPGIDVHAALTACQEHLVQHGGHAAAAGLRIDENHIDRFRSHFCEQVERQLAGPLGTPELWIDAETTFSELSLATVREMERMAPFGQHNPRPLLCANQVTIAETARTMGQGDRHVAVSFTQHEKKLRAIAFHRGEWADELQKVGSQPLNIAFRPIINEFRGRQSVELHLSDWKLC